MSNLGPEDHAELQRLMAMTAGDADEKHDQEERKRLPDAEHMEEWFLSRKFQSILRSGGRRRNYLAEMVRDARSSSPQARDLNKGELAFVEAGLEALRFWKRHAGTADEALAVLRTLLVDGFTDEVVERAEDILARLEQDR